MRYQSQVLWRDPVSSVADSVIGGALRDCECDIDAFQRLLGDAAIQEIERECAFAMQLHVRTIRLHRFPCGYDPIRLDWRSAWTRDSWAAFVAATDDEEDEDAQAVMQAKVAKVASFFSDDEEDYDLAPLSISYPDCNSETGRSYMDPAVYSLLNSESGDSIVRTDNCMWPQLPHAGQGYHGANGIYSRRSGTSETMNWGKNYVEIKYVVGFASPTTLRAEMPLFVANMAALFNYRYENPEIMAANKGTAGAGGRTYDLLMQFFNKHLKWRV